MNAFNSRMCRRCLLTCLILTLFAPQVQGQDYFPLRVGSEWHYKKLVAEDKKVLPGEAAKIIVRVTQVDDVLLKDDKGKKDKAQVYTLETTLGDKKLSEQVGVLADGVYRFSTAGKSIKPPLPFLKFTAKKGQTWECDCTTNDTPIKGTFTLDEEDVAVPAGKFQAITASASKFHIGDQTMSIKYWFAPNLGIVKQYMKVRNYEVVLELQEYRPGK